LKSPKKNILLIANSEWYLKNFRLHFLNFLRNNNFNVILIFPIKDNQPSEEFKHFKCIHSPIKRGSLNPVTLFSFYKLLKGVIKDHNINLINVFSLQLSFLTGICNLFLKVLTIYSITGLGYTYVSRSIKALSLKFVIQKLSKYIFNNQLSYFIFQNKDDQSEFYRSGNIGVAGYSLIYGSGVDVDFFKPLREKPKSDSITFLFAGRLLRDKGFIELISAYKEVLKKYQRVRLLIAGDIDSSNPESISRDMLKEYENIPGIEFLGHIDDIRLVYSDADIVLLPSYREGLSRVLIEAASSGLPIITTDTPGCREVVDNSINGFLVKKQSSSDLLQKMTYCCQNPKILSAFGHESRKIAKERFCSKKINQQTLDVYNLLLANSHVK